MKYLVFFGFLFAGVPVLAALGTLNNKVRGALLSLMIFSTVLGSRVTINLMSMEHYRGPDRGFEISLGDLLALALIISLVLRSAGGGSGIKYWPFNTTWLLLFFAMAVPSAIFAPVPIYGAFTLWKMIRIYMLYWCVVNTLRTGVDIEWVWYGFLAAGLVLFGYAFIQKYDYGFYRVNGTFDHSNTIPPYSNLIIPAMMMFGLVDKSGPGWRALLFIFGALGLVFAVLATQSRAGLLLSGGAVALVLVVAFIRAYSTRVLLICLLVTAGMIGGGLKASDTIIQRFLNAPEASGEARHEFNQAAKLMAKNNTFGVGINNFSWVLTYTPQYNALLVTMAPEKESAGVAHHIYLLTAAEMGYPGLVVFCIIMVRFLWRALRYGFWPKSKDSLLLFGLFMGLVCLDLQGFLEWAFRITPVTCMFAIVSGTIAFLASREKTNRALARRPKQIPGEA